MRLPIFRVARFWRALLATTAVLGSAGCTIAFDDKSGRIRHVILGFGIVTVESAKEDSAASVVDALAIGLSISNKPFTSVSLGYSHAVSLLVPPNFAYTSNQDASQVREAELADKNHIFP